MTKMSDEEQRRNSGTPSRGNNSNTNPNVPNVDLSLGRPSQEQSSQQESSQQEQSSQGNGGKKSWKWLRNLGIGLGLLGMATFGGYKLWQSDYFKDKISGFKKEHVIQKSSEESTKPVAPTTIPESKKETSSQINSEYVDNSEYVEPLQSKSLTEPAKGYNFTGWIKGPWEQAIECAKIENGDFVASINLDLIPEEYRNFVGIVLYDKNSNGKVDAKKFLKIENGKVKASLGNLEDYIQKNGYQFGIAAVDTENQTWAYIASINNLKQQPTQQIVKRDEDKSQQPEQEIKEKNTPPYLAGISKQGGSVILAYNDKEGDTIYFLIPESKNAYTSISGNNAIIRPINPNQDVMAKICAYDGKDKSCTPFNFEASIFKQEISEPSEVDQKPTAETPSTPITPTTPKPKPEPKDNYTLALFKANGKKIEQSLEIPENEDLINTLRRKAVANGKWSVESSEADKLIVTYFSKDGSKIREIVNENSVTINPRNYVGVLVEEYNVNDKDLLFLYNDIQTRDLIVENGKLNLTCRGSRCEGKVNEPTTLEVMLREWNRYLHDHNKIEIYKNGGCVREEYYDFENWMDQPLEIQLNLGDSVTFVYTGHSTPTKQVINVKAKAEKKKHETPQKRKPSERWRAWKEKRKAKREERTKQKEEKAKFETSPIVNIGSSYAEQATNFDYGSMEQSWDGEAQQYGLNIGLQANKGKTKTQLALGIYGKYQKADADDSTSNLEAISYGADLNIANSNNFAFYLGHEIEEGKLEYEFAGEKFREDYNANTTKVEGFANLYHDDKIGIGINAFGNVYNYSGDIDFQENSIGIGPMFSYNGFVFQPYWMLNQKYFAFEDETMDLKSLGLFAGYSTPGFAIGLDLSQAVPSTDFDRATWNLFVQDIIKRTNWYWRLVLGGENNKYKDIYPEVGENNWYVSFMLGLNSMFNIYTPHTTLQK